MDGAKLAIAPTWIADTVKYLKLALYLDNIKL